MIRTVVAALLGRAAAATVDGTLVTRTGGSSSGGTNSTANLTGSFTD